MNPKDILRADTAAALKLRRWRKKLGILLRPNALGMAWRRSAAAKIHRRTRTPGSLARCDGVILMYHRVASPASDPQLLCVTPPRFAEHLAVIQERFRVIPLRELVRRSYAGESLRGIAAITFDDGYADNLHHARPVLERFGVPATVFVASGYVGGSAEFWWDELERLLLQPGTLVPALHLQVAGHHYTWDLNADARYETAAFERHRSWNVQQRITPTRRHALYRCLHTLLFMLTSAQREDVLDQLRTWANRERHGRPTHLPLTEDETVALAKDGLVEIGAHTVTHPVLSMLPIAEQKAEIAVSKARLQHIIGQPVASFAYPYGTLSDYKAETVKAVEQLGFECACSTFPNVVTSGRERFQLPRFTVRDWNGDELRRHLQAWTHR
jgi:peptidoglycan/xylan/chitin deacetylase (PgdA/CDA1 family)